MALDKVEYYVDDELKQTSMRTKYLQTAVLWN